MDNALRKTNPDSAARGAACSAASQLHPLAKALLSKLPQGARLDELAAKFPRIADRIAYDWQHPEMLKPYLLNLLTTDRPGREGFTLDVLSELLAFQAYYCTHVFPDRKSVWENAL